MDNDVYYEEIKHTLEAKYSNEEKNIIFTALEGYAPVQGYGWFGNMERFYFRVSQTRASLEIGYVNPYLYYLDQLLSIDMIYPALELGKPLLESVPTFEETKIDYSYPELTPNIITYKSQFSLPLEQTTLSELFSVLYRNLKPESLEPQKEIWNYKKNKIQEAFLNKQKLGLTYFIPNGFEESC